MTVDFLAQQQAYADLIIHGGVNFQPGQGLRVRAELGHRDFVRLLVAAAYDAGARHVDVMWTDPITAKVRFEHIDHDYLGYLPEFEVARAHEQLDDRWALVSLTGDEYPDAFEEIDPAIMRQDRLGRIQKLKFFQERVMNNEISWCVASVPVAPWAQKVFPDLDADSALQRLWQMVLYTCRADQPDPMQAWADHDANLKTVAAFMDRHQVRSIRFLDETPGPDGRPSSDLTVGLTDAPNWSCGSSDNAEGRPFFANIPTEEIFTSPHKDKAEGWVRTSKPGFPFERELLDAYFHFENGQVVEWHAEKGQDALDQMFEMPGARQLGELALVDVRSPINQSGLIFHNTLFDENAACHIAFGRAYPEGVKDGNKMTQEELEEMGVNAADTHQDLMIGTDTMTVIGICVDGSEVLIMKNGMFVDEVVA